MGSGDPIDKRKLKALNNIAKDIQDNPNLLKNRNLIPLIEELMGRGILDPIPLKQVAAKLHEGIKRTITQRISEGVLPIEAVETAESNLVEFGAMLASPEFMTSSTAIGGRNAAQSAPGNQIAKGLSPRQALIEEIKHLSGGYIVGKRPGKNADFHAIDRFSGKQASMDVFQIVGKPKRSQHHAHKYAPKKSPVATFKSVQPAMKKLDENTEKGFFLSGHTFFGFISQCYNEEGKENRDGFGRPYSVSVIVLLSHATADKLFEFIMREDPNIIQDVYQALFPATCDMNRIKLVKGMNFEREGQKYRVPDFKPRN